jgi:hypothetical protein
MQPYGNSDGDLGIVSYETTEESILVKRKDGWTYEYNYATAGRDNVEEMKRLAAAGRKLDDFIAKTVKGQYARKWL